MEILGIDCLNHLHLEHTRSLANMDIATEKYFARYLTESYVFTGLDKHDNFRKFLSDKFRMMKVVNRCVHTRC